MDVLSKVDENKFEELRDYARLRVLDAGLSVHIRLIQRFSSGINMYADMQVVPMGTTHSELRQALASAGCDRKGESRIYVYDVKNRLRNMGDDLAEYPFRRTCAVDLAHWRCCLYSLFGDPAVKADKKVAGLFGENDLLVVLDGRSTSNSNALSSEMAKVFKKASGAGLPARLWTCIRRMYTCTEFSPGEYASPARCQSLNPKMAEPLESLYLVFSKKYAMPLRSLPKHGLASNRTRAWPGLRMKTLEEQEFNRVTRGMYEKLLGSRAGGSDRAGESIVGFVSDDEEPDEQPTAAVQANPAQQAALEEKPVFLAPWEAPEPDFDAVLSMYKLDGPSRCVFFLPGSGMSVLAAVRRCVPALVICESETHKAVIFESVLLRIMYVMICGSDSDGFELNKRGRVLSRQSSLTGAPANEIKDAAKPAESDTAKAGQPTKSDAAKSDADMSDDETSDDSD